MYALGPVLLVGQNSRALGKGTPRVSGHGDPAPPQPTLFLSRPQADTCPSGGHDFFVQNRRAALDRSRALRGSARMRLNGPTGPGGLGTVECVVGIGKQAADLGYARGGILCLL